MLRRPAAAYIHSCREPFAHIHLYRARIVHCVDVDTDERIYHESTIQTKSGNFSNSLPLIKQFIFRSVSIDMLLNVRSAMHTHTHILRCSAMHPIQFSWSVLQIPASGSWTVGCAMASCSIIIDMASISVHSIREHRHDEIMKTVLKWKKKEEKNDIRSRSIPLFFLPHSCSAYSRQLGVGWECAQRRCANGEL